MQKNASHLKFNENLEALRGFAAVFVVFFHLQLLNGLFNRFYDLKIFNILSPDGHLWVLLFFVLSGYVIAASNLQRLTASTLTKYLKKRFIRIYPIYLAALGFTLLISTNYYSFYEILINVCLLQVLLVSPFAENLATWSLHYEVLYYLFFVPFSFLKWNPLIVLGVSLILALANYGFYPNSQLPIISSYLFGFSFWMAGLCISRYSKKNEVNANSSALTGSIFMLMSTNEILLRSGMPLMIDQLSYLLFHQHLLYPKVAIASQTYNGYRDLFFLPYCVHTVMLFAGRVFKYSRQFYWLLQGLLLVGIILICRNYTLAKNHEPVLHFVVGVIFYLFGLALPMLKGNLFKLAGKKLIDLFAWIGSISYAIYILHFPLIFAFGRIDFFNQSMFSYIVRLICFAAILTGASYLLERKLHLVIRKRFFTGNTK